MSYQDRDQEISVDKSEVMTVNEDDTVSMIVKLKNRLENSAHLYSPRKSTVVTEKPKEQEKPKEGRYTWAHERMKK